MDTVRNSVFYHIYPLGFTASPFHNHGGEPVARLDKIADIIPVIKDLGVNALYLGPVFESSTHGYDTVDYFTVDRRLGTNDDLARLSEKLSRAGIRLVLDGVFNHTGREHSAFRDVREKGGHSPYASWYHIDTGRGSPCGDPFNYQCWQGHTSLPRLNWHNPEVQEHIAQAVRMWAGSFGVSGLRLDAADALDGIALAELRKTADSISPDFWLLGEVIHGDYRNWANSGALHSVTNYEAYKGLWSSLNDRNYFEIAYALRRQSGQGGLYAGLSLYNFTENHDVNRAASLLKDPAHLFVLYGLLFTMPGIPSIYYGGEYGVGGMKENGSDAPLRPSLDYQMLSSNPPVPGLREAVRRFAALRNELEALRAGGYREILVAPEQFVFARECAGSKAICALNSSDKAVTVEIRGLPDGKWRDALSGSDVFQSGGGKMYVELHPRWLRVLTPVYS